MSHCPTCGQRIRQPIVNVYSGVVDHILKTFERKKGAKYPFSGMDGKLVKKLLALYDHDQIKALWDVFLAKDDDWTLKVGHKITEFWRQIPVLLDKSDWKTLCKKYQSPPAVTVNFKQVPMKAQ